MKGKRTSVCQPALTNHHEQLSISELIPEIPKQLNTSASNSKDTSNILFNMNKHQPNEMMQM
jgi:hypothetical protein